MPIERAYISGPLQAANDLPAARRFYEWLAQACIRAGISPYLPHQRTDPALHPDSSPVSVFRRDHIAIEESDLLIAHIGHPSSGVGAELGLAFSARLPIIAVHREEERPSRFVLGMLEDCDIAIVISFSSKERLTAALEDTLSRFAEFPVTL